MIQKKYTEKGLELTHPSGVVQILTAEKLMGNQETVKWQK